MPRKMRTSRASNRHTNGELREGKSRLDCEKPLSKSEGWVMAFSASGTRPKKALCQDTVLDDGEAGEKVESEGPRQP